MTHSHETERARDEHLAGEQGAKLLRKLAIVLAVLVAAATIAFVVAGALTSHVRSISGIPRGMTACSGSQGGAGAGGDQHDVRLAVIGWPCPRKLVITCEVRAKNDAGKLVHLDNAHLSEAQTDTLREILLSLQTSRPRVKLSTSAVDAAVSTGASEQTYPAGILANVVFVIAGLCTVAVLVQAALFIRTTRERGRAVERLLGTIEVCRTCGYVLEGLRDDHCPECGELFRTGPGPAADTQDDAPTR